MLVMKLFGLLLVVICIHVFFSRIRKGIVQAANEALTGFPKTQVEGRDSNDSAREQSIRNRCEESVRGYCLAQILVTAVVLIYAVAFI